MFLYGRSFTLRTDHQALTSLLATSGTGHRPLRLHRWAERLQCYNYSLQFTPGRNNVVADLLSRSVSTPAPSVSYDRVEEDIVNLLQAPLQAVVSLTDLKQASEQDTVLCTLRTYIREGWPSVVPEDMKPFARVKDELSCWNGTCVARGLCTIVPSALRARVLEMAHSGHLGIVKLKQRCRNLIWWPGIDRDLEAMVRDCAACLVSGKTGAPAPPPLHPVPWPAQPWDHIQLDICGEIYGAPHHQRFLVVAYDLHAKWPEVTPVGTVTSRAVIDILQSLFSRWGLPKAITTDNGPQFISTEFSAFLEACGVRQNQNSVLPSTGKWWCGTFQPDLKEWDSCSPGPRVYLPGCFTANPVALQGNTTLHHWGVSSIADDGPGASLALGQIAASAAAARGGEYWGSS